MPTLSCNAIAFAIAALSMISPCMAETPVATDVMSKAQAREKLAACGAEWQRMKRAGADGSLIWREFSKTCMSRQAPSGARKGNP
jgi:hypothetical protein